jgi:hypothetical protein|tara:strand:+ start:133 stop:402 length:270 start_codon:yes stop_codon:yes gene_type:complete
MGKLTVKQAEEMVAAKLLNQDQVDEMKESGLVSTRKRGNKYYMIAEGKKRVYPQLYFQGLGKGGQYSTTMSKLRDEFNKLRDKYAKKEK